MIPTRILGTGAALMGQRRTTMELCAEVFPGRDPKELQERSGILERWWVEPGTTAATVAAAAVRQALERAALDAAALARIILVTSTGGDHLTPATANDVAAILGLDGTCDAFDLNNACVGFLTALDLAGRSVATGFSPVAVVAVEIFSRQLSPLGPRAYLSLGDGAAAVVLGPAAGAGGIVASSLKNTSALRGRMVMEHAWTPGARGYHDLTVRSREGVAAASFALTARIGEVLSVGHLLPGDVDWWVVHQPNSGLLPELGRQLRIAEDRLVSRLPHVGNVGSASIPLALDQLWQERGGCSEEFVVMAGFGAGAATGAILFKV